MVNLDNINNQPGLLPTLSSSTHTVGEVPLTVYYDEENYSLIDQTETVQVTLTGSQTSIQMFQMMRPSYEVFVDVTAQEEGTHTLQVEHRGFRNDVTVAIVPEYARVVLQEKQTYSLPVTVELVNEEEVEEGYSVGTPIVTPVNVTVKAARDAVAEVATAKAYVNISEADGPVEDTVPVKLYDRNGNELSLETEPSIVEVKVPITSPNKTVPIKITREGELPDDLSLESLVVEPREVTIFGSAEVIDEIDVLEGIILELSELEDGEPVELEIPLPEGIEQVEPETILVTPTISEKVDREFEDISLEIVGESAGTTVSLASGEPSTITVLARGALSRLEELTREDIQVFIDVSQEGEGEHEVDVQVNGPRDFAFVASQNTITVNIRLEESDD